MKTFLTAIFFLTCLSAFAAGGTDRGNPGDEYSKAFASLGYDLAQDLAKDPLPGVDASALLAAVRKTQLHSEATLELRGFPVDAINYPDPASPSIVVSRAGWDRMGTEPHRRAFLVLHEYLSIMGIDDSKYEVSSQLDRANVCSRTPAIRAVIERELKKSCYRIIEDDLQYVVSFWLKNKNLTALKNSDVSGVRGLENLYLGGNDFESVDPGFFTNFPRMDSLETGSAIRSLDDCSFLSSMPVLRGATFGLMRGYAATFRPLRKVAPKCFASLPLLTSLSLDLDGATTPAPGFLAGLSGKMRYVFLRGTNLDRIDPKELVTPAQMLELDFADHAPSAAFTAGLSKATGKTCNVNESSDPDGPIPHFWSLSCGSVIF